MKRLSDYTDEEAIDLWADLMDPITEIITDEEINKARQVKGATKLDVAKTILKLHKSEAVEILLRIDPEPINGLNIIPRFIDLLLEIQRSPELKDFLGLSGLEMKSDESSGSATGNTGESAN